jgi:[ribosomal protein S5]-alanine N-acetyltransferase
MASAPLIHCGPCLLRPWSTADIPSLVRHANDIEVAKRLRDLFPHPYTIDDARAWIDQARHNPLQWAIESDGAAIGGIGIEPGTDVGRYCAELGYWLGQACWGRGIATAAVLGLTAYVFRELELLRLYAMPFAENTASCRVLEKAGFVREGVLRASAVKAGRVMDQARYARVDLSRLNGTGQPSRSG